MGTNEGEKLFLPPRSAVPGPSSPIGMRELISRIWSGGCFLVFFALIGVGLFLFGLAGTYGPYRDSLRENGDPRFFLAAMAFGFVFFLFPLRMLQLVVTGEKNAARIARARKEQTGPRWQRDYPWNRESMPPDYEHSGGGSFIGRVAFLSFIGLFNMALQSPSWVLKGIVLVLDVLGLAILYDSISSFVQWLRYSKPVIRFQQIPIAPGGRIRATISFSRPPKPVGQIEATLRCVQDQWTNDSGQRQLQPFCLWKRAITIEVDTSSPLRDLQIDIQAPENMRETDLSSEEAVYWQLLLQIPVTGPDFGTIFLIPIYSN